MVRIQGSTNKFLNAYASVRFILIRCTPFQGPRTRNITKVYLNSRYNILLTCFLVFFHLWPSNPNKPTPKNQRPTKRNKVISLFALCPLSSLRFPNETQLSTTRAARKFSFATCTATDYHHATQEYQHAVNIIFVFVHNIHIHINLFSFQLRYTRTKMWPLTNTPPCLLFGDKFVIFMECKHLLKNI